MSTGAIIIEDRVRIPADALDLSGFRAWAHSSAFPDSGRVSYIDGEIEIDMSPEELMTHNAVKTDLCVDLGTLIRKLDLGRLFSDRAFLVNESASLATEPDLMFCAWESIETGRVMFAGAGDERTRLVEVRGAPDLVCEVVSRSSVRKDTVSLRSAYYSAGIAEYWLIDARGNSLKFQILARGRRGYVAIEADGKGYRRSAVLGRSVRLTRRKDKVEGICYRLLSK